MSRVTVEPYRREVTGGKGSLFYRTHAYHTKVPPEGIVPMLEHYTDPGDVVLDPFCGSGMTGVACLLAGRRGMLSDLSPAAVHIATGHTTKVDPAAFANAAARLLNDLADLEYELYGTTCARCGEDARIEYTVWSDTLTCPGCDEHVVFWEAARRLDGGVSKTLRCPHCSSSFRKAEASITGAVPVLVSVACRACRGRDQRPPTAAEADTAIRPRRSEITDWYPTAPFENWREMWRGQHRDLSIATAADFFTDRNLQALAAVWSRAGASNESDALRFATTAIINRASRRYQWNPKRPTNVLSGTLYIASLNYEFNVFSLLRRKLSAVGELSKAVVSSPGSCQVTQCSATALTDIPNHSIDYVCTDPPFGANIYYSDASFLWEAWLDTFTPTAQEAIVSTSLSPQHGGKTLTDYEKLMTASFNEISRVLKPDSWASVMFHNSDDAVWSSLERALESADLSLESAISFDKSQPSFKGVKQITNRERVPSFDLVLHLRCGDQRKRRRRRDAEARVDRTIVLTEIASLLTTAPPRRRTTPYVHSFVMRLLLQRGWPLAGYSYRDVEALLESHFTNQDGLWTVQPQPAEAMS